MQISIKIKRHISNKKTNFIHGMISLRRTRAAGEKKANRGLDGVG